MKVRFDKNVPLLEVESPRIGSLYHLSWARKRGMVWRLVAIDGEKAIMKTPKTGKDLTAKLSDLRHTRRTQAKIISNH